MSINESAFFNFDLFIEAAKNLGVDEYVEWLVPQEMEIEEAIEKVRKSLSDNIFFISSDISRGTIKAENK